MFWGFQTITYSTNCEDVKKFPFRMTFYQSSLTAGNIQSRSRLGVNKICSNLKSLVHYCKRAKSALILKTNKNTTTECS